MSGKYDDAIRDAAARGLTVREALKEIDIHPAYLSARCKVLGINLRKGNAQAGRERRNAVRATEIKALFSSGITMADIARKFGISRERVRQILAREGIRGTPLRRVVVRLIDLHGNMQIYHDAGVEVIVACEYTPADRLYRSTPQPIPAGMLDGEIGFAGDGSAAEAKVTKFAKELFGRAPFDVIPGGVA